MYLSDAFSRFQFSARLFVTLAALFLLTAPALHAQEATNAAPAATGDAAPTGREPQATTAASGATDTEGRPQMTAEEMDAKNPYIQQGLVKGYAKPWQIGFQKAGSPVMDTLNGIHNYLNVVIALISLLVLGLLVCVCVKFHEKRNPVPSKVTHNTLIEVIWTVVPIIILVTIAVPSLRAHYFMTKVENPNLTLKVTGNQWYWSYEYLDDKGNSLVAYDSHMIPVNETDPAKGQIRILSVDNPLAFPKGATVRVLMTGADVIHAWAMPAMGVKSDAVPGRMNETWFRPEEEGIFYGQCSELCGTLHAFMPIEMHVVEGPVFDQWLANAKAGNFAMNGLQVAAAAPAPVAPAGVAPAVEPAAAQPTPAQQ